MLKPFVVLSAAALVVFAFPAVPTFAAGGPPQANPVKPTAATLDKAKKLYAVDCAVCHGDSGNGKTDLATSLQVTLLDWTDPKSLASKSDQDLFDSIRKGKDKMPAEDASRAKNDDVWGLRELPQAILKERARCRRSCGNTGACCRCTRSPGHSSCRAEHKTLVKTKRRLYAVTGWRPWRSRIRVIVSLHPARIGLTRVAATGSVIGKRGRRMEFSNSIGEDVFCRHKKKEKKGISVRNSLTFKWIAATVPRKN